MSDYLSGLLLVFLKSKEMRNAEKQIKSDIISAIRDALRNTKIHIHKYRIGEFGGQNFHDVQSQDLVERWAKVARLIRPFDQSLAKTYEAKSDYWSDPHQFRREVQNDERWWSYNMRLDEVERELIELERNFR